MHVERGAGVVPCSTKMLPKLVTSSSVNPMNTTAGRFLGIAHLVPLLMALSAAEGGSSSIRVAAFAYIGRGLRTRAARAASSWPVGNQESAIIGDKTLQSTSRQAYYEVQLIARSRVIQTIQTRKTAVPILSLTCGLIRAHRLLPTAQLAAAEGVALSPDRSQRRTLRRARRNRAKAGGEPVFQLCDATTRRRGHVDFVSTWSLSWLMGKRRTGVVAFSRRASSGEDTSGQ